jgi:hypothetical protein
MKQLNFHVLMATIFRRRTLVRSEIHASLALKLRAASHFMPANPKPRRTAGLAGCPPRRMIARQAGLLCRIPAPDHARARASLAQGPQQPGRELSPPLRRERATQGFRSPAGLQRFVVFSPSATLHPAPFLSLRPCLPSSSPLRRATMEGP